MKLPLSLLKRFLVTDASLDEIAAKLTAIGLEVDGIDDPSAALQPFVVAEILEAEKHPQADKLQVCNVKTLSGTLQIVCGAPNARAGIKVALAPIGSIIPTNQMEIKKAAVRGVESQGMLCSARELGLGDDHAGIMELPATAQIGQPITEVLGLGDPVLDLNITANRGDCMGALGVARDLAAAGIGKLKPPCVPTIKTHGKCPVSITIEDSDGCPAFLGRVIRGVKNGPSPEWMQRILTAAGMRPISALVDITNYFSLAFGRPLHVYDLVKLDGGLVVRKGRGEPLAALNDKTYTLTERDCVIADGKHALGIGGIMGGSFSGVTESTTDVLLEIALFNPLRIAQSGRALQIDSDARARFERGVDSGFLGIADVRATEMILEFCGGEASERVLSGTIPDPHGAVPFDPAFINALGGVDLPAGQMKEILSALGFVIDGKNALVPTWRHDVSGKADLAEEVLRITGYDAIPAVSLPKQPAISHPALDAAQVRNATLRRAAAARGLHEIYSWGFCSERQAAAFGGQSDALKLINPISADLSVMRPKLLPHLIEAVRSNHARGAADIALFELGAVFEDITPQGQKTVLSGVRTGQRSGGLHWSESKPTDLFDVKADAMAMLDAAGIDSSKCMVMRTKDVPWFHPGRSGVIAQGPKNILASFGELHPALLKQFGIDFPVFAFALFIWALPTPRTAKRKPLIASDYQSVSRDFAFVVDAATPAAELVAAVGKAEKTLLRDIAIFDVYAGKGVPEGKKSIALTVTLQAADRTLTDAEIDAVAQAVIGNAMKIGAVLR